MSDLSQIKARMIPLADKVLSGKFTAEEQAELHKLRAEAKSDAVVSTRIQAALAVEKKKTKEAKE